MTHRRRSTKLAAVLTAAALAFTACGGDDDTGAPGTEGTESPSSDAADDSSEEPSVTDAPATTAADGPGAAPSGTLRYSNWQETPSMDPAATTVQNGVTLFPTYDTLTNLDETFEAVPWLATSWEQPDPLTWRFELRDDVVFHDGSAFDAETVKLNLERGKTIEGGPYLNIYGLIDTVEVVDTYTADVKFNSPSPNFPTLMGSLAGAMVSPQAITDGVDLTRTAAGSGGWIWDADAHVEGSMHVYNANPEYWNPDAVRVERIELMIIEDDGARQNALESGQIDIMATVREANQQSVRDAGFQVFSAPAQTASVLIHDRGGELVPALADERVREAIGLLIDRNAYNSAVYAGTGDASIGGFASPGTPFYSADLDASNPPSADVERARELLAEAGYADGFDLQLGNASVIRQQNETIAQLLAAGGIRAEIVDVGPGQYTAEHRNGTFGIGFFVPTSVDIWNWWSRTVSNNGPYNPWGLDDLADLEQRYLEATNSTDLDEQIAIMTELQKAAIERGVIFPLGQNQRASALSPDIGGTDEMHYGPDDTAPRPHFLTIAS